MNNKNVTYIGEKSIEFELQRKNVKNINLRIRPDLSVVVSANSRVPYDYIERFVQEKSGWILRKIENFNGFQNANGKKEYVSGETIRYLGRQYRLRVRESDKEDAKFYKGYIYIYVKDKNDYKKKEKLFYKWLQEKAEEAFHDSLARMYPLIGKYGVKEPSIKIRRMKTRWGSCSQNSHSITLNLDLVKAPKACIDYVLLHELIHFKYRNHNKQFYNFLTALMPDWKERKEILDSEVGREL